MALVTEQQAVPTFRQRAQALLRARRSRRGWSRYSSRTLYLFLSPWIVGFLGLTVLPLLYGLLVSFTDFSGISPRWHWVGFANYVEAFHDADVWQSLLRTLVYMGIIVPLSIAGGLGLALLLNQGGRFIGLFRAFFYLPVVVPVVATTVTWQLMFGKNAGPINALLEHVGVHTVDWFSDQTVFAVLCVLTLWGIGGGMILSLAALQGVPQELREAAIVDGATPWQQFRSVTLPLISPVLFFQVVIGVIAALQVLVQPLLLTTSGEVLQVQRGDLLYMVNVYLQFFNNSRYGYGSALLWILFAAILLLTLGIFRTGGLWVYYEVDQDQA